MRVRADIRKLRVLTIVLPVGFVLVLDAFSLAVLQPLFHGRTTISFLAIFLILIIVVLPFSLWVFAVIERQQRDLEQSAERLSSSNTQLEDRVHDLALANQEISRRVRALDAAHTAIVSISSDLEPSHVLQTIVDVARDLLQSRYAALAVADGQGHLDQLITSGITAEQRAAIGPLPTGHGLLGALVTDGAPLRIANMGKDPRSYGFPPHHPPMTSLLAVPIVFQAHPVGHLYLTDKIGADEFREEEQELLLLLASHAAVAIEHARLYKETRTSRDRLQAWSEELEERVALRTREIERYTKELTTRVLQAQEEERKRLARELHDDTAQSLSTLLINLDLLEQFVPAGSDHLRSGLDRIRTLTERTLDTVRTLSHDLRPTILDDFGLAAALRWYAEEYERTFGVSLDLDIEEPQEPLPLEVELALFRIAQQALTNSGRHAAASRVRLALTFGDSHAILTVADDGIGYDPERVAGPSRHGGLGLYGMQERAALLGATFDLDTAPGKGTRIVVSVPVPSGTEDPMAVSLSAATDSNER